MSTQVKLGLYVVTLVGTLLFGSLFLRTWHHADAAVGGKVASITGTNRPAAKAPAQKTKTSPPGTNAAAGAATNTVPATNAPVEAAEAPAAEGAEAAGEANAERESIPTTVGLASRNRDMGNLIFYGLLGVASLLGLGGLIAYDTTQYMGRKAADALFDHDGEDLSETAYEKVESAYGRGEFLEAVRLLREFLVENPKAIHAKLRIAEIYEKDLNNPVAATLEYEEVLKFRFEPERRGWAGVHLVNLYNRLDKPEQALAWLQRVVTECPGTPAAAKAKERLEALGYEVTETPDPGSGGSSGDGSDSGLPPGFRKR